MILTGEALRDAAVRTLDPEPDPEDFGPTSVDVRAAIDEPCIIESGEHLVVSAEVDINIPRDLAILISGRSSHMRRGLFMPVGWLDPGFVSSSTDPLKLEFGNTSDGAALLEPEEAAARLTFFELHGKTDGYEGRYGE